MILVKENTELISISYFSKKKVNSCLTFSGFFWPCHSACGLSVLQPGTEFTSALEAQSLKPWTAKEVPMFNFLHKKIYGKLYICGISRYFTSPPPSGEYSFSIIEFSLSRCTVLEILTNVFRQVASPQSSPNFSSCLLIVNTLHHSRKSLI